MRGYRVFYVFSTCFSHGTSISVTEHENYLIMVTSIIHLIILIIQYVKRRCIAPIASNVGRTRKRTEFHILKNATSETKIESNAFPHTRKEQKLLVVFPTHFLVLLRASSESHASYKKVVTWTQLFASQAAEFLYSSCHLRQMCTRY